ncbi:MAG: phospho-N-acetylmuramoyl-pentapeptide-transferase [Spirochaetes bacterium]|nr:phospho-N-acetylmuramoyl-pentapeptide-transferase [Spirochaetota bacterium]
MLRYIENLKQYFGPFRLFGSNSFISMLGFYLSFFLSFILLPKFSKKLPYDRGRNFALQSEKAKGKPTGAGVIFITIFIFVSFLVIPFDLEIYLILILTFLTMLFGFLDDKSEIPWNEYKKGLIDLILAFLATFIISYFENSYIWIPFYNGMIYLPKWLFNILGTFLIWISINTTNCSDGVDGLSGMLVLVSLITLGFLMYFILGHKDISKYLLLPHIKDGAIWGILSFVLTGALIAYIWYNAFPSIILMGDAGSRALGFFIGVLIIKIGNPFIYFIVSTVLLINGGTGLVKVAFIRFLRIRIFKNTRFPLHDHFRETRNWSNTQVMVKFLILQLLITLGLLGIFLKIR